MRALVDCDRKAEPTIGAFARPGTPDFVRSVDSRIRPPIATMLPSCTRTTVSDSLMLLDASGSLKLPDVPRSMFFVFSTTFETDGCTCRMIWLCSSICGVTSNATPEKNGCTTIDGDCVAAPVADVSVVVVMFVTKNSSLPTFSTAFWLLSAAMRGLDSTCSVPCVCRNDSIDAKLLVWNASPKTAPGTPVPGSSVEPGVDDRTDDDSTPPSAERAVGADRSPPVPSTDPGLPMPAVARAPSPWRKAAQLMPVCWPSASSTSMIFASSITCRSMVSFVALRNPSTERMSAGMPRTTITPDCGLTTTCRPFSVPTIARSESASSRQKSLSVVVMTRLPMTACEPVLLPGIAPGVPGTPGDGTPGMPGIPVPGMPAPGWTKSEIAPDVTRTSLRPRRVLIR